MVRWMLVRSPSRIGLSVLAAASLFGVACASAPTPPAAAPASPPASAAKSDAPHRSHGESPSDDSEDDARLGEVARVHGGAGPWAVLGYRMGQSALATLHLARGSFDLDVRHESPKTPQYACVADGAQAATGASLGKVNLSLIEADEAHIQTTYRNKKSGESITLRPTAAFRSRFLNVPRAGLRAAGAEVLKLPEAELFEVVPAPDPAAATRGDH